MRKLRKKIITFIIIVLFVLYARDKIIEANQTPTDNSVISSQLSDKVNQGISDFKNESGNKVTSAFDKLLFKLHLMNEDEARRVGLDTDGSYKQSRKLSTWFSDFISKLFEKEGSAEQGNQMEIEETEIAFNDILERVPLIRVVDGDTIIVQKTINGIPMEVRVRLIGLDTPESVHEDASRNNEWGKKASEHTKELLKNVKEVYLQYDQSTTDQYGRDLCYVWLSDNVDVNNMQDVANQMLNAIILRDGFAKDKVFLPNAAYADFFSQICEEAKATLTGLWTEEGFVKLWE